MRLCALALIGLALAPVAQAHELLSWWRRGLIEVDLQAGAWSEFEIQEWQDGESVRDTLRCTVLDADGGKRWVEIERPHHGDTWIVALDLDRLKGTMPLLFAFDGLYRRDEDGTWSAQSLEELKDSSLARGRLEDPFKDPTIERGALADSLVAGRSVRRERVRLHEKRDRVIPQGSRELRYAIELTSEAVLSPDVPVFGLLRSETVVSETTRIVDAKGNRVGPPGLPQQHARSLRCLAFGRGEKPGLPGIPR